MNNLKYLLFFTFLMICGFSQSQTVEECDKILVEAVKEMNQKNHARSLELLTEVKSMAQTNNWSKQLFLAINNIGANYYLMLDYGEALDNYLEAYKIALKDLDAKHEMIVLNNIAILYSKDAKNDKAEEYFLKAYEIAKENNDSVKIGLYATNLATVANAENEIQKAESYIKIALPLLKNMPPVLAQAKITNAQNLVLKGKFEEAKEIALELLPTLKTSEFSEHRISIYMILSKVYENENNLPLAIDYVKRAGKDANVSLENKIDIYNRLTELYRKLNDNSVAFAYKDSVLFAKDSLSQIKNGKLFENSRIKFELQNYQKELSESQSKLKSERKLFYMILGGILFLILITLWAIWNYFSRLRQTKIIAESNQKIAELELEKQKNDKILLEQQLNEKEALTLLEQEKFKNEIEAKNRQLAAKALSLSTRNELIEDVIDSLSVHSEISQNPKLRKSISELKNQLKRDSDWDDFFSHFEEVNHGFLKTLKEKHPDLTSNDVRYISYVYMNLSTKEISLLLNITVEACRKRKERIIKKMNLAEDADLYNYLSVV
ncbi:Tetratricopeptide repeat-containing protein [Moheibacter sediminis]|uniref:Tetratricopeptide repeat-containing protein n=2 Tax=Moheibacter sediminis TaxID=1434700 RepID=A0A1W1Y8M8_9FLAO|nr:Tetratricopeptide repeat-containing protein [Moheibacter sediminis]